MSRGWRNATLVLGIWWFILNQGFCAAVKPCNPLHLSTCEP